MAPPFPMLSHMDKGAHRVGARLGNLAATHKKKTPCWPEWTTNRGWFLFVFTLIPRLSRGTPSRCSDTHECAPLYFLFVFTSLVLQLLKLCFFTPCSGSSNCLCFQHGLFLLKVVLTPCLINAKLMCHTNNKIS